MTSYGFTGPKSGCSEELILQTLKELNLTPNDTIVTGACTGLDSQISHLVKRDYPFVKQKIVVPYDRKYVDVTTFANGTVIEMPEGTSYRNRNEKMVSLVGYCINESGIKEGMIAFWNGNKRSGTYMTMNIARRQGKLFKVVDV